MHIASFLLLAVASGQRLAYVTSTDGVLILHSGAAPSSGVLAWASYDAAINRTGWSFLSVSANASEPNATLASYAAGYLEGYLTNAELAGYTANTGGAEPNSNKLAKFLEKNTAWMRAQVAASAGSDPYWAHVEAVLAQVQGLHEGQLLAGGSLSAATIYQNLLNGGDMFNLAPLYGASHQQLLRTPRLARAAQRGRADHCSALVRLTPGSRDILVSHTTWSGFESLGRAVKRYDLALAGVTGQPVPGRFTLLSGYPGLLQYSSDDIYVLGPSALVTLETTIDNDNATLAEQYASHEVVLEWLRNILANRLASSGSSWAQTFSRYASGTYTNQWMVLDSKLFTPGTPPPPHTLTVLEEMPGHIRVADRTASLSGGSSWGGGVWASYNVVSDPYLFNISGQQALVEQYGGPQGPGAFFTYLNTSRANIFRRDNAAVATVASMAHLMRSNSYKTDPLARLGCGSSPPSSATNAIADRSDLNPKKGDYKIPDLGHGDSAAIDAKVVALSWLTRARAEAGDLAMVVQSGPTVTDSCPVFSFSAGSVKAAHEGYPDTYDFGWYQVSGNMNVTEIAL
jgi:hypothetical protein